MLLLDANVCSDVLRGRPDVAARLAAHGPAIDAYARLRTDLRAAGTSMGANDLTIAAIALTHDLGLVSDDHAAFARVPALTVTSWRTR